MVEGILGKKLGMTHIYSDGVEIPVTVIEAGWCQVTQKKTRANDGYDALQLGFAEKKEKRVNMPMKGHFKKAGSLGFYHLAEFACPDVDSYEPGQTISCGEIFSKGDYVDISGTSKGKGFQGVVKRWNFSGGPASHGSRHGRTSGSIGQSSDPSRVFKGMKMAGHMGARKVTVQNVKVVDVRKEENLILVKGAVPGATGAVMVIKKAVKKARS